MKSYAPSEKSGGGTLIKLDEFRISNIERAKPSYGVLVLDVSKINTLTVGSVTTINSPNYAYIRCMDEFTHAVLKNFVVSNNPQSVDVSNFTKVDLAIVINSSSADYGSVSMNNITGK